MILYDAIGKNYAQTRKSDRRIASALLNILSTSPASIIADIGAGTGSYSMVLAQNGYQVVAIEPSETMRNQATSHAAIQWIDASAEHLPLPDQSIDVAIVMLAFHHFRDYRQALREMHRVTRTGRIVLLTYDPAMIANFWLTRYFPSFISDVESTFLPITTLTAEIQSTVNTNVNIAPFALPFDLADSFAAVGWARPELYLNRSIRNGISSFAKLDLPEVDEGLSRLQNNLESGQWDQNYGYLRNQAQCDVGYRFVYTNP
jgi:ubiquinone/menaquinone biosynthesis C-methylase UbiE